SLADNMYAGHRFSAARAGVGTANRVGDDSIDLSEADCKRYRELARQWLGEDLAAWERSLRSESPLRKHLHETLTRWQTEADLVSVREPAELKKLPPNERTAWHALWNDVEMLLSRAPNGK